MPAAADGLVSLVEAGSAPSRLLLGFDAEDGTSTEEADELLLAGDTDVLFKGFATDDALLELESPSTGAIAVLAVVSVSGAESPS